MYRDMCVKYVISICIKKVIFLLSLEYSREIMTFLVS